MAKNSPLLLQKNVKDNSEELQDFLKDLKNWEKEIKTVDETLSGQNKEDSTKPQATPPVRCKKKLETSSNESPTPSPSEEKRRKNENDDKKTQKISTYDYAAWDKFDVDKALASSSEDELEACSDTDGKGKKSGGSRGPKASKKERAAALKDQGNKLYSSGELKAAIAKYTQGMAIDPTNALLPANRAMAFIKINKFEAAESDCNRCLKLDGGYVKGYLRRATARLKLGKTELAFKDYQKVLELEPWNKEAKKELEKHKINSAKDTIKTEGTEKPDNINTTRIDETKKPNDNHTSTKTDGTKKSDSKDSTCTSKTNRIMKSDGKDNNSKSDGTKKSDGKNNTSKTGGTQKPSSKAAVEKKNEIIAKTSTPGKSSESSKTEVTEADMADKNEDSGSRNVKLSNGKDKPGKKLKVIEINSQEEQKDELHIDPDCVLPVDKPPHLRSTKPLKRIPVIDVPTKDSIGKQSQASAIKTKMATDTKTGQPKPSQPEKQTTAESLTSKDAAKVVVSNQIPRTSHQFTQEWSRISRYEDLAIQYLKIIPPAFLSGVDLETDTLVDVMSCLRAESVTASLAAQCLLALSKSSGFSVSTMFFDDAQKRVFHDVMSKCDGEAEYRSQIENLKTSSA